MRQLHGQGQGPNWSLKTFLGLFSGQSFWGKCQIFVRLIFALMAALIIWLSGKLFDFLRRSKKNAVIVIALLTLLVLLFFSTSLRRFMPDWLFPLVICWIVAITVAIVAKMLLPKTIRSGRQLGSTELWPWIPIAGAVVLSLIYLVIWGICQLFGLTEWKWWTGAILAFVLVVLVYFLQKSARVRTLAQQYQTDMVVIGLSIFGIVAVNLLVRFLTTSQPKIWEWYWSNQAFFWAFNAGLVVAAFLTSKRKDGKIVPTAATVRFWVMLALLAGLGVNLVFHRLPDGNTALGIEPSETEAAVVKAFGKDHPLVAIAGCVSEFRQSGKDGKVYLGPGGGIGLFQFNPDLQAEADKFKLDLTKTDGQIQFAKTLYADVGTWVWLDSVNCWGEKVGKFIVRVHTPDFGEPSQLMYLPAKTKKWFSTRTTSDKPYRFFFSYDDGSVWEGVDEGNGQVMVKPAHIKGEQWAMKFSSIETVGPTTVNVEVTVADRR